MAYCGDGLQLSISQVFTFDNFDSSGLVHHRPAIPPPALNNNNSRKFDFDIVTDSTAEDDGMDATVNDAFTVYTGTHTAMTASPARHAPLKGLSTRPTKEVKIVHGSSPKGLFARTVSPILLMTDMIMKTALLELTTILLIAPHVSSANTEGHCSPSE